MTDTQVGSTLCEADGRGQLVGAPSRAALADQLVAARIAGDVATARENNLDHFHKMADGDPLYQLGLTFAGPWAFADILAVMARLCGVDPDPTHTHGQDRIDPELTITALDRAAARLAQAAARRERVLLATGHPEGILALHTAVGRALAAAGCELLEPPAGLRGADGDIRPIDGVSTLHRGGLLHTHSAEYVGLILDRFAADGNPPPDLVFADHGWAGGAAECGIETVGFADCNDPALFVGEAAGKPIITVPLDDNVYPPLYRPLTGYLLAAAGS